MNPFVSIDRSVRPAAIGFLVLTAFAVATALANRAGLLDAFVARRAIGVLVGLMAIVIGNFVPKMRPLGATDRNLATVAASERMAGWILVLIGTTFVGLFTFAPLEEARALSPLVAGGGLVLIAGDWIWAARTGRSGSASRRPDTMERRTVAAWLLFALAFVLITASLKLLTDDAPWVRGLGSWVVVGFTVLYSLFFAVLGRRRRAGLHAPADRGPEA